MKAIGGAGAGLAVGMMCRASRPAPAAAATPAAEAVFNPFVDRRHRRLPSRRRSSISTRARASPPALRRGREELDAAFEQVKTVFAPADAARYANLDFGMQGTGGSTSIHNSYEPYRKAGAAARAMLVEAAAKAWGYRPARSPFPPASYPRLGQVGRFR